MHAQFAGDRSDMVYKSQVLKGKEMRSRGRVDVEIGERKDARLLPTLYFGLDLGCPKEVCLFWGCGSFVLGWHVHVGTAAVMLGAIPAAVKSAAPRVQIYSLFVHAPLGEVLITTNVAAFTRLTAFTGLGMTGRVSAAASATHPGIPSTYLRRGGPPPGPAIVIKLGRRKLGL